MSRPSNCTMSSSLMPAFASSVLITSAQNRFTTGTTVVRALGKHTSNGTWYRQRRGRSTPRTETIQSLHSTAPTIIKRPAPAKKPSARPKVLADGDSLHSTVWQQIVMAAHFALTGCVAWQVGSRVSASGLGGMASHALLVGFGYVIADLAVGVYHHAVDNYGNADTPIFGFQIASFQGHHTAPWTITSRGVANNLYRLTIPIIPQMLALLLLDIPTTLATIYASFLFFIVLSQETHRQAHMTRPALWARVLQGAGLVVSQREHLKHHRGAFEGNYCILSGHCNSILESSRFFRWLEGMIYVTFGVEPVCWNLDRKLKIEGLSIVKSWRWFRGL